MKQRHFFRGKIAATTIVGRHFRRQEKVTQIDHLPTRHRTAVAVTAAAAAAA
jgi:hypothetical protein